MSTIHDSYPGRVGDALTLGPVELRVTDADRAARFWEQLIGLRPLAADGAATTLGTGYEPLIVLRETATRAAVAGHSGLYHVAVHVPTERELGRILGRLERADWPISPVDHLFSQAIYLRDPDGITVELARETPWRMREARVGAGLGLHTIDHEGRVHRPSEPLDLPALRAAAEGHDPSAPADGAYIGHLHLAVPDLGAAVAFYRDRLGMTSHVDASEIGFADLHAGGVFPHRVALNTFAGAGAPMAPSDTAGLERFTVRYADAARLDAAAARLEQAGTAVDARPGGGLRVRDPAGGAIDLIA
jgi:catechol 2,3-dioxygenase